MTSTPPPSRAIVEAFRPRRIDIEGKTLTTTPAFDAYWYFAAARQEIFFAQFSSGRKVSTRWFEDDILRSYRFTNAYRASDRVSQYLIRKVIGEPQSNWSREDFFFRIMLFKIFNKIETWEALEAAFGEITFERFDFLEYDNLLSARQDQNICNYSAAYIMPSAGRVFGHSRKHSNHLALLDWMINENLPERLSELDYMSEGYELLASVPSFGPFLAYQFVTDLNYSSLTSFNEMEFVVAGPGARDGASKCFEDASGVKPEAIIAHMAEHQVRYFAELGHEFCNLWGRPLQLIDCQNLFCEISKYARVAFPELSGVSGRTRIKQKYKPNRCPMERPVYPQKWGINARIEASFPGDQSLRQQSPDCYSQASLF